MAKAKSAPKPAPRKAAPKPKAAAKPKTKAKAAPPKAKPAAPPTLAAKPAAPPPPVVDVAPLQAELTERRAQEGLLRAELEGVRAQLADLQAQLAVTHTELKLAQATAKERVDAEWASQTAEQDLAAMRDAAKKAEKSAEASRAEANILRGEIDRLRAQLHGRDSRPPTLQGVGEPTPAAPEEGAPQKAMPDEQTSKNPTDDKPGFWGRLFKGKKDEGV